MQLLSSSNKNLIHDAEIASEKTTNYNPTMALVPLAVQKGDDSGVSIKWYLNCSLPLKKFKPKELTS